MAAADVIPGMESGSTDRNVIIGLVYLVFFPLWPFPAAYVVATNRGNAADRLSRIPGISTGGGVVSGIVTFVIVLLLFGLLGAALPGNEGSADDGDVGAANDIETTATTQLESDGGTTDGARGTGTPTAESTLPVTDTPTAETKRTPTATPKPETTQSLTPTPTAETTQSLTPTPTPEPTPAPDETSYSISGSGNDVTDRFDTAGGLVVIAFEHDGDSNFQVQAISSDGDEEYLVNAIGDYDGEVALHLPSKEWRLDVTADGSWSAEVNQPRFSTAEVETPPVSRDGRQAAWIGPIEFEGGEEVTFEITDDSQAGVWLATHQGERVDLLHNEIGPYEGSTIVTDSGVGLIIIETDSADWRIEISK